MEKEKHKQHIMVNASREEVIGIYCKESIQSSVSV